MGRYSLVASNGAVEKEILIKELNTKTGLMEHKKKVHLATIDKYTLTYFSSEKQFLYYLEKKGIIDKGMTELYISYNMDGPKQTEVLYNEELAGLTTKEECDAVNEHNTLLKIARKSSSNIPITNSLFIGEIEKLLHRCMQDKNYFEFLVSSKAINEHTINYIADYCYNKDCRSNDDLLFIKYKIINNMSNYKMFRDTTVVTKVYYDSFSTNEINKVKTYI